MEIDNQKEYDQSESDLIGIQDTTTNWISSILAVGRQQTTQLSESMVQTREITIVNDYWIFLSIITPFVHTGIHRRKK